MNIGEAAYPAVALAKAGGVMEIDKNGSFLPKKGVFNAILATKRSFSTFCVEKFRLSISSTKIVNINFVNHSLSQLHPDYEIYASDIR